MEISVIYPAFNEEASLADTIGRSLDALRPVFSAFEVLIIDDASRDATGRIADALAADHPEVRVVHNERNCGQGASLRTGFRLARYSLVLHNAVDYPFDLRDLPRLTALIEGADVVVASRRSHAGYSLYRRVASRVNVTLLNLLFGLRLRDYNFVQLYRKTVLDSVHVDTSSTAFITPEILIRAHDQRFRIRSVPIDYHPRLTGIATSGAPKVVLRSVRDMFNFWRRRRAERTVPAGADRVR